MKLINAKQFTKKHSLHRCGDCYCQQRARDSARIQDFMEGAKAQFEADIESPLKDNKK